MIILKKHTLNYTVAYNLSKHIWNVHIYIFIRCTLHFNEKLYYKNQQRKKRSIIVCLWETTQDNCKIRNRSDVIIATKRKGI
jgi:hypothetical protein